VRQRHERKVEPEAKAEYAEKERKIETERNIKNSRLWSGVPRESVHLAGAAIQQHSSAVKAANNDLKTLANFQGKQNEVADQWKAKAQKCRGDLPGFWNDFKHELGCEVGDRAAAPGLNGVLDLLELAEQKGGLGTWLEEWNVVLTKQGGWSWDLIEESITNIKVGIQFCKAMLDAGIERDRRGDATTRGIREKLHFALDAIASEIARQVDEIYNGNRVDVGKDLDAVVERLKEASPRAQIDERLHVAFEAGNAHKKWYTELPDPVKRVLNGGEAVSKALEDWQGRADDVKEIAEQIGFGFDYPDIDAAGELDAAASAFSKKMSWPNWPIEKSLDKDAISIAVHVQRQMCNQMIERQKQLAKSLRSEAARHVLEEGDGVERLSFFVKTLRPYEQSLKTSYYQAGEFVKQGKAGDYWDRIKDEMDQQFGTPGGVYYDPQTDQKLKAALRPEPDLGKLLKNWSTKWNSEPDMRYQLTWQLIATLRRYKQIGDTVLKEAKQDKARTFLMTNLDALTDVITEKVRADVAAGTA
jgi:hypothetical protein